MKGVYLASTAGQKETRAIKINLDRKRVEDAMRSGGKFRRGSNVHGTSLWLVVHVAT
jgi:hypothetical protein